MKRNCISTSVKKAYVQPDFKCIELKDSDIIATSNGDGNDSAGGQGSGNDEGWG